MTVPIVFPDVEAVLVAALTPLTGVTVATRVPDPRPDTFLTVTRVGGTVANVMTDRPMVTFDAWAPTTTAASDLGRLVRAHVFNLAQTETGGAWVRRVVEVVGLHAYPDPRTGTPRYSFSVQLDTRGAPLA